MINLSNRALLSLPWTIERQTSTGVFSIRDADGGLVGLVPAGTVGRDADVRRATRDLFVGSPALYLAACSMVLQIELATDMGKLVPARMPAGFKASHAALQRAIDVAEGREVAA